MVWDGNETYTKLTFKKKKTHQANLEAEGGEEQGAAAAGSRTQEELNEWMRKEDGGRRDATCPTPTLHRNRRAPAPAAPRGGRSFSYHQAAAVPVLYCSKSFIYY